MLMNVVFVKPQVCLWWDWSVDVCDDDDGGLVLTMCRDREFQYREWADLTDNYITFHHYGPALAWSLTSAQPATLKLI